MLRKLVFFACCVFLFSKVNAQKNSALLSNQLNQLNQHFNVDFAYDVDLLHQLPGGTIDLSKSLEHNLNLLQKSTLFDFVISGSNVLVSLKSDYEPLIVTLRLKDEFGEPAIGILVLKNKTSHVGNTDVNGKVIIQDNISVKDTLTIKGMGYESVSTSVYDYLITKKSAITIKSSIIKLPTAVVNCYISDGIEAHLDNQTIKINTDDLALLPGEAEGDVLRSIKALPGINSPDGKAGNIYIRGSSPDQSYVLYDHIPVYHRGHFYGTISPYYEKIINTIEVSRSGYHPKIGGRVGGVLNIKSSSSLTDTVGYGLTFSTIHAGLFLKLPIAKNKLDIILSGRTAYPNSQFSPKLESITDMVFQSTKYSAIDESDNLTLERFNYRFHDINFKVNYHINHNNGLFLSYMKVFNDLLYGVTDDNQNSHSTESYVLYNQGVSIDWKKKWSKKINMSVIYANSAYEFKTFAIANNITTGNIINDVRKDNAIKEQLIKLEAEYWMSNRDKIDVGAEAKRYDLSYRELKINLPDNFNSSRVGYVSSIYQNIDINRENFWLDIGTRTNYYNLTQSIYIEPRLKASQRISKKTVLKSSMGQYYQFANQLGGVLFGMGGVDQFLWVLSDGDQYSIPKSQQAMIGALWTNDKWLFDVEGYVKRSTNLPFYDPSITTNGLPFHSASSDVIGVDVMVKHAFGDLNTSVNYSISKADFNYNNENKIETIRHYFDQTHILNVIVQYPVNNWSFSLGWKFASGLSTDFGAFFPGIVQATGPLPPQESLIQEGKYEGQFYPNQHQLDLSIVYKIPRLLGSKTSQLGVSIFNLYNQQNYLTQTFRATPNKTIYNDRYSIGFSPNVTLNLNW